MEVSSATARPYIQTYWERLLKLDYPFLRADAKTVSETALKFTLSIPGVHTAIVGTIRPGRWQQNAEILSTGLLAQQQFESIRTRWMEVAGADWTGEVLPPALPTVSTAP